jgi:hypothetical protein
MSAGSRHRNPELSHHPDPARPTDGQLATIWRLTHWHESLLALLGSFWSADVGKLGFVGDAVHRDQAVEEEAR